MGDERNVPVYTEEQAIAGMIAGHRMAGMEPTPGDVAAARRGFRGESTAEEERARVLAEITASRNGVDE